jgi:predicted transcriptional regulator
MKKEAVARLCLQSYEQGGCLTNAELGILLKISPNTVSKYISEWESEHETILPRRGTIHDMGPSITHKKISLFSGIYG